ncbi:MAG: peptidylprolyl isomerase [Methylococcales bacterium]|nr:peptidylprolyl isomerase [Methylococcales bacterium]
MNKTLLSLVIASAFTLTACKEELSNAGNSSLKPIAVSKEDAVASVNGQYISKKSLETLEKEISQRSRGQTFPKDKLVEELIQRELLVQEATQKKLDNTDEFNEQLVTIKNSLLSQAAVQDYIKSNPVTDAELKAEYDSKMVDAGNEYKARHILVKEEAEAKKIIAELIAGADFAALAKTKSTGPSGPKGGDLGWFGAGQMVAPFSEAVAKLENNKFTTEPVKTQFGWHIILREESRAKTPATFDSVKEQIRPMLQRQKVQDFLSSLREKAKVEVLLKAEPPKAAPTATAPTSGQQIPADLAKQIAAQVKAQAGKATEGAANAATQSVDAVKEVVTKAVTQ